MKSTKVSAAVNNAIDNKEALTDEFLNHYQSLNPDFWKVYYLTGKYYFSRKDYSKAKTEFEKALTKEITTVPDKRDRKVSEENLK
jgi:tetratricopeptide (TPR) repeat protein